MIVLDDRYEELDKIIKESIEEVKKANYDELKNICKRESLIIDENLKEEEIRKLLISYYEEEIGD